MFEVIPRMFTVGAPALVLRMLRAIWTSSNITQLQVAQRYCTLALQHLRRSAVNNLYWVRWEAIVATHAHIKRSYLLKSAEKP